LPLCPTRLQHTGRVHATGEKRLSSHTAKRNAADHAGLQADAHGGRMERNRR